MDEQHARPARRAVQQVVVEVIADVATRRQRVQHAKAGSSDGDNGAFGVGSEEDGGAVRHDRLRVVNGAGVIRHREIVEVDGTIFDANVQRAGGLAQTQDEVRAGCDDGGPGLFDAKASDDGKFHELQVRACWRPSGDDAADLAGGVERMAAERLERGKEYVHRVDSLRCDE